MRPREADPQDVVGTWKLASRQGVDDWFPSEITLHSDGTLVGRLPEVSGWWELRVDRLDDVWISMQREGDPTMYGRGLEVRRRSFFSEELVMIYCAGDPDNSLNDRYLHQLSEVE